MDYVYPSHEGHDPARATGLQPPPPAGTMPASAGLHGHSGQGNQEHLRAPVQTGSPAQGPSTGTQDHARTRVLPASAADDRCQIALRPQSGDSNLPRSPGLGNLQESLYVEYCGWLYGLPENSLPELKRKRQNERSFDLRLQSVLWESSSSARAMLW